MRCVCDVQVAGNGNVIGAFTPVKSPAAPTKASFLYKSDPSLSTCLLSLRNAHGRPCRLRLKAGMQNRALNLFSSYYHSHGPGYGYDADLRLMHGAAPNAPRGCSSYPYSFELNHAAEREAGLPPLPFAYIKWLLGGDDGAAAVGRALQRRRWSAGSCDELTPASAALEPLPSKGSRIQTSRRVAQLPCSSHPPPHVRAGIASFMRLRCSIIIALTQSCTFLEHFTRALVA